MVVLSSRHDTGMDEKFLEHGCGHLQRFGDLLYKSDY